MMRIFCANSPYGKENCPYAVYYTYCTKQNNKFIGNVEPYGGICEVLEDCPKKISEMKAKTIWQRIKTLFN